MLFCLPLPALEMVDARWGFAGEAVPEHFALLSLLLQNDDDALFEGELRLQRGSGAGRRGVPWRRSCVLAPGQQRWVQFLVWAGQHEEFSLSWREGEQRRRASIHAPRRLPPQAVYLAGASAIGRSSALPHFPEELFPTSVAACDGLDMVLLDHLPNWREPRRRAFCDWLRRGGCLVLARGADGRLPRFGADWPAALRDPALSSLRGGRILRIEQEAFGVDRADLAAAGYRAPHFREGSYYNGSYAASFHQQLRQAVTPDHEWGAMIGITVCYLLLLFPGQWLLARRFDWRWALGAGLAVVLLCALLLSYVGRRGYGESGRVDTVTLARLIDAGRWDIAQWGTCFVTTSDHYTIAHEGAVSYASAETTASPAVADLDGKALHAEIPLFASQAFLARAVQRGPDLQVALGELQRDGDELSHCTLHVQGLPGFEEAYLLHGQALYSCRRAGATVELERRRYQLPDELQNALQPMQHAWNTDIDDETQTLALASYAAGGLGVLGDQAVIEPDRGRLTLLLASRHDPRFAPAGLPVGERQLVLYRIDLRLPESEP